MPRFHDGDASQDAKRKRRSARGTAVGEGEWLDVVERVGRWVRVRNAKGELRVLANPIRIDGERLAQAACSPLGADNDSLLGKRA